MPWIIFIDQFWRKEIIKHCVRNSLRIQVSPFLLLSEATQEKGGLAGVVWPRHTTPSLWGGNLTHAPPASYSTEMRTYLLALAGLGAASAFAPHGLPPPCVPRAAAGPMLCLAICRALCCARGRPQLRAYDRAQLRGRACASQWGRLCAGTGRAVPAMGIGHNCSLGVLPGVRAASVAACEAHAPCWRVLVQRPCSQLPARAAWLCAAAPSTSGPPRLRDPST